VNKANDNVTSYLNQSLGQPWFDRLRKLRNQITHKPLPILQVVKGVGDGGTTKIKVPNDPANSDPDPIIGYSDNLESNQYCEDSRREVLGIIEHIYPQIKQKIKQAYNI
jgi:hypothetical protein